MVPRRLNYSTIFKNFERIKLWLENGDEILVFDGFEPVFQILPVRKTQPSDPDEPKIQRPVRVKPVPKSEPPPDSKLRSSFTQSTQLDMDNPEHRTAAMESIRAQGKEVPKQFLKKYGITEGS